MSPASRQRWQLTDTTWTRVAVDQHWWWWTCSHERIWTTSLCWSKLCFGSIIIKGFRNSCTLRSFMIFVIIIDNRFSRANAQVETIWRLKFDTGQAELNIIILWPKQFDELTKATFLKPQTEILMHCLAFVKAYMVLSVKGGGGVRNTIR